jgi:tetratricopeptide (TPR) repeat protein
VVKHAHGKRKSVSSILTGGSRIFRIHLTLQATLAAARSAEREKRWRESFSLCQQVLAAAPSQPDALNLLGRLFGALGDAAMAIALQSFVLRLAPGHAGAETDLAVARAAIASADAAERLYAEALAIEPDIAHHHRSFGALQAFAGMERVEGMVRAALDLDPSSAQGHAALGNILTRRGQGPAATSAYGIATMLDWSYAEAHLALSEFFEAARDEENAGLHRREALARKAFYEVRAPHASRRVLVLRAPGGALANLSLDFCTDPSRVDLDVYYVTDGTAALPATGDYDAVFSALTESERFGSTIERCIALLEDVDAPIINHPRFLRRVRRSELHSSLRGVADCAVPGTSRLARCDVEGVSPESPLLIRPVDTHRGDGMGLVASGDELRDYLQKFPDAHFNVTPFIDYRSAGGYYRKYRVIVVAGKPFPYHLAISEDWLVHYWRVEALMRGHAWMREEELQFLREPHSVFPNWERAFGRVAEALGLDYFGVDCSLTADGRVLIFECDPASFVHCRESVDDVFAYKHDYVPRIFNALEDLIGAKSAARTA